VASQPTPGVLPSQLGTTSPNYLGRAADGAVRALYAELDELRVYERALSAAEVSELYRVR